MYKKHILSFTVAIILLFTQVVILAHEENQSTSQSAEIPYEEVIENNSDAAPDYNDTIKTEIENLTEEYNEDYVGIADKISAMFLDDPMITKTKTVENVVGDGAQIIGINGKIYCFGTDLTLIYDIDKQSWSSTTAMPTKRTDYAVTELNGKIYIMGGTLSDSVTASKTVEVFDASALKWGTAAEMIYACDKADAVAIGNNIYCHGLDSDVYIYNTISNSWSTEHGIIEAGEYTSSVIGNDIYYTASEVKYGNKTYKFDTVNSEWTELQMRPNYIIDNTSIGKYKLLSVNNLILCIEYSGAKKANSKVRYAYIPENDNWIILPDKIPELEISNSAFTIYNNQIFVLTYGTYNDGSIKSRLTVTYFIDQKQLYTYNDTIAVGKRHILNYSNGVLMSKGDNTYGQLGDGTTNSSDEFVEVQMPWISNGESVKSVAAGGNMSYVITDKYNLYVWGQNDKSQLGNGDTKNVVVPTLVEENVIKIAAGEAHTIILKRDTSVWTSGNNSYGQLGNNSTSTKRRFAKVADDALDISTGRYQSYIIGFDGKLKGCGLNSSYELGLGNNTSSVKVFTDIMTDVKSVSGGNNHTAALDNNGNVYVWGSNKYGQLGMPQSVNNQKSPHMLTNIGVVSIAKAGENTTIYVSGGNAYQSGFMGYENRYEYKLVENISNISELAAGDIIFAKTNDDEIFKWGLNTYSQKFNINSTNTVPDPIKVTDLIVRDLDSKRTQTLAIDDDGHVLEWGRGYFGMGSDQEEIVSYPAFLKENSGNIFFGDEVKRGKNHNLLIAGSGELQSVYGWGSNSNYPLGRNNHDKVRYPENTAFSSEILEDRDGWEYSDHMIYQIAAGAEFSIGCFNEVTSYGEYYTNTYAMGKGYTDASDVDSEQYLIGKGYEYIDAGYNFVAAIDENHHTTLWGDDEYGQLAKNCPDDVYDVFDGGCPEYFTEVKCGPYFCIGLTNFGNVYSWGKNSMGQLGLGYTSEKAAPQKISGLTDVVSVGVGHDHAMAVKSDGTVWTWGNNSKNQLGRVLGLSYAPGQVMGITNAKEVTGGYEYTIVVDNNNCVWTFGSNEFGALGIYRDVAKEVYNGIGTQHEITALSAQNESSEFSIREFMKSDEMTIENDGYTYEKIDGAIRRRKANV